jgi:TRAP-type C4-dicarboxylate transport system permease small subunit
MTDTSSSPVSARVIIWLCDGITRICLIIAGLSLLSIVAINGANVVARYFFGRAFSWAEELMLFLMILGVFSGAIAVTWRNVHIRIDTIVERLPPAFSRAARLIASLASIVVLAVVMVASFRLVSLLHSMDQRSDALNAPSWLPQSFVTIGLGLMALMILARLVIALRRT